MIRAESVITAAIGTVLGIVLGIAFTAIVSRPLAEQGFVFEIPIVALILVVVLAPRRRGGGDPARPAGRARGRPQGSDDRVGG